MRPSQPAHPKAQSALLGGHFHAAHLCDVGSAAEERIRLGGHRRRLISDHLIGRLGQRALAQMVAQQRAHHKALVAELAAVRPLAGVRPLVDGERAALREALAADFALVRPYAEVDARVLRQVGLAEEALAARRAHPVALVGVREHVPAQMVLGAEHPLADVALHLGRDAQVRARDVALVAVLLLVRAAAYLAHVRAARVVVLDVRVQVALRDEQLVADGALERLHVVLLHVVRR